MPPPEAGVRARLLGVLLVTLSASVFSLVDGFSKMLAETNSVGQLVWARYAMSLPILLALTRPSLLPGLFRTRRPGLQILRGLAPLVVGAGMVLGVRYLPLADATVILFAAPFLVILLSGPLLGERVGVASWVAVVVGFLAVVVVARPGLSELSVYAIFPLIAAVFYALLQLLTRQLAEAGERSETTLAWTLLTGFVVSLPLLPLSWEPLDLNGWLLMAAIGVAFGVAQLLMIRGFALAPASLLAPLTYVQIVAAVVFGIVVLDDLPDLWTLAGSVAIIAAGLFVVWRRE